MRFLPVFLDLQGGPVLLVGAGDLVRAKLRLLAVGRRAHSLVCDRRRSRCERTGGRGRGADRVRRRRSADRRSWRRDRDLLRGRRRHRRCDVGARKGGRPARQRHGRPRRIPPSSFPAIVDRGDVVVAVGTGGASPVVARRVRERIEAMLPARIGDLAAFIGRLRKSIHGAHSANCRCAAASGSA